MENLLIEGHHRPSPRSRGVTDKLTRAHRSANMAVIPLQNTSPELIVRRLTHGMGYRHRLHVATLPSKPDLSLRRLRKIIDVRGCFWHQHSNCIDSHIPKTRRHYWKPKLVSNCRRDKSNVRNCARWDGMY